ncbi:hypothetical protein CES85_3819 [Ochrobactrum quorumnocens]|uniref:Uncharacterized protein n=1 Tax=Ochrobactrum quorumnocens TaxID=271865 RepID=A0A248U8M0_9HYPH|nr:hypothetical protein CES85_3819 [[Ochrobactrum] quorumnocens]
MPDSPGILFNAFARKPLLAFGDAIEALAPNANWYNEYSNICKWKIVNPITRAWVTAFISALEDA